MNPRRGTIGFFVLAALAAPAACDGKKPTPARGTAATAAAADAAAPAGAPAPLAELRIHLPAEPAHLQPLLASDFVTTQVVLGDVFEPLFSLDAAGQPVPALAASVQLVDHGRRVIVQLRAGATWADDGSPVTTDDVRFSFEAVARRFPSVLSTDLADLERIDLDPARPGRVELVFREFRLGRAEALALVPIVPRRVYEALAPAALADAPVSRRPFGSGPYTVVAWEEGREIRLRRRADLPAHLAATLPREVVYRIVPDRAQAAAQLAAGELDLILAVAPGPLQDDATRGGRARLVEYAFPYYLAARWNCRAGRPTADAFVRRALTMTLDRATILREVLRGRGRLSSSPWAPDDAASDPAIAPWPFDPASARRLLVQFSAPAPRVRLLVPAGSAMLERIATIWQADARAAGIALELVPDADPIGRARRGDFDGVAYGWTTGPEMDFFHHFHSTGTDNYGACSTPELDALLAAIRTMSDPGRRATLEHEAHAALHALQPYTIIVLDVRTAAVSSRIAQPNLGAHGAPVSRMTF